MTIDERASRPAAIVFDFDGTIADTEWSVYVVVRDAFRAHDLDMPLEEWVDLVGRAGNPSLEEMLASTLGRPADPAVLERARAADAARRAAVEVLPGVIEVMDTAAAAGLPLAVASSSPSSWVDEHLDRLGLTDRFAAVRTRDHVDRAKPDPDLFLAASAALGVDPTAIVAIEDSLHGCAAAKAAGMTCVVVPNRITRHALPTDADHLIESLLDFPYRHFGLPRPSR